jgi:large subunit ribosomal protein L35Ae
MSIVMEAIISAYRGSYKTQVNNQMILIPEGVNSKEEAAKLYGKKAVWTTQTGNKIEGIITKPHGNKGAVRVRFDHGGLPGQALGTKISIE